ncbi:MAG: polysaccharide biosynthesis tyrosine autokinase [Muribaculaceae bacterium]|nr:polysaccharide biosynthesis tyrosine autokinase [Muribaculaceae bacterium]
MEKKLSNNDFFDLRGTLNKWMSKWYWFAISAFVCVSLVFVYTKIKKPIYLVQADVLITPDDGGSISPLGDLGQLFGNSGYVQDELYVISAHSVNKEVARRLNLHKVHREKEFILSDFKYDDFQVDVYSEGSVADTLRMALLFKVKVNKKGKVSVEVKDALKNELADVTSESFPVTVDTKYGKFVVDKTKYFKAGEDLKTNIVFMGYDAQAENLSSDLDIYIADRKSNVIKLGIETQNIEYGKDILNGIIAIYNERGVEERALKARQTLEFIDERLAMISSDLSESESDVEKYKKEKGIVDVGAEAAYQTGKRGSAEAKLVEAETQLDILKMTKEFLSNPGNQYDLIPTSVANEALQGIITRYNEMIMARINLLNTAKESNISVQQLNQRIGVVRGNIMETLERTLDQQRLIVSDIRRQLGGAKGVLAGVPTQEKQYRSLLRQQSVKEQLYLFLLQRREETAMLIANSTPKAIIVDEAYAQQEPLGMKRSMKLFLAFLFGLLIPVFIFWLMDLLKDKFGTTEELRKHTALPILGEISVDRRGDALAVKEGGSSTTAELFRLMRSQLQFLMQNPEDKVVMVTSTIPGEGKSFISINLAASLAIAKKRVILVGMDIRKPRLAQYLGLPPTKGLTEFLADPAVTVKDIILPASGQMKFDVISAGPVPPNPAELLLSDRVDELFDVLRREYDYVIIDSAPVGVISDSFNIVRITDVTIFVTRANHTKFSDVKYMNRVAEDHRLKNVSVVLNGTKARQGYGYGYGEKRKKKRK